MDRSKRLSLPFLVRGRLALTLLIPALALLLGVPPTGARTLSWSSMRVEARLDGSGVLHIVEEQAMVFDGDWNGGERGFRLDGNHRLELHRMTRLDSGSGSEIEMIEGDLDRIDRYDWVDGETLRWRSRLPSDPPFDRKTIVYRLTYTLEGALRAVDGDYLLDHDFAFPNRPGPIQSFELELEFDPVWAVPVDLPRSLRRSDLSPGQSVVLTYRLGYVGPDRPSGVVHPPPRWLWLSLSAISLACMAGLFVRFLGEEMRLGRFSAPQDSSDIGPDWIEENVFKLLPEEVGALWDRKVGPPEVAALVARLVADGLLSSSVTEEGRWFPSRVLTLELQTDLDNFRGYEKMLLGKLFFDGRTTTDTQSIREHYKSSGFSPVATISASLERRVRRLPGTDPPRPAPSWKPTAWLSGLLVVLALLETVFRGPAGGLTLVGLAFVALLPSAFAWVMASGFSYRLSGFVRGALGFVLPGLFVWLLCFGGGARTDGATLGGVPPSLAGLLVLALLPVVLFNSFLNWARSRDSKSTFDRRYRLLAVRRWFESELERDRPRLRDEWFPYLLAFGLDKDVDHWFEKFGGTGSTAYRSPTGTSSTGDSSGSTWTGGGGAFGGGGSTAAWGAAAAGLASGVSAPSSGGSGGGSGGGGGSSGGGSGGGW